ncbi:MogA/MoaB family molybdenum cofactor biosynthesis protein [Veillonella caviae]|uniref:MogA/MoaB family molybdenum cofactor biosynthesis protein n=1 Tax=Veillonella caviae TaxID=248316 RepID=UPI000F8F3BFD|nr:molybdenum cofactor biosynthesis protein B [Veillonella caviae]MCF0158575.1 molybdenum cofactor biosynthesis protein MoaB [Veillonella sp.]MCI5709198.1 molybdenum cofactor biosynthesis protein MoaB [Veillonella caviae]MCI6408089.1 molybdenum cofactor biosynthesis protein MoaB [Veillonella caviae]MCI7692990.1 molybdenum cofactor biosynthesis protein MoaB [Veillonella caviae]MDD7290400.1 molybdenum cofactor biosynthesis protein MoaB [Veillonella caviae]
MSHETVQRPLGIAILTVSDTRTIETDKGGNTVEHFVLAANHSVKDRAIVIDDYNSIRNTLIPWCNDESIDVIITTGGTGIAARDVTIEAVKSLFEKQIPGFGEIFRYLSYTEDIGTKAIASRAEAGVNTNTLIFSIPGSVGAVTLAMSQLIIPEMPHLVREITK